MRVEILVSIAGRGEPNYRLPEFDFVPGQVVDLDDFLAASWIAAGRAQKAKKGAVLGVPPASPTDEEKAAEEAKAAVDAKKGA